MVLILGGVAAFAMQRASALEYRVTAKVPAPIPDGAAVILRPADGSGFTSPIAEVSGTCPAIDPAIIVSVWRGSRSLGSVVCSPAGTFSLNLTLQPGENTLVPKITTITFDDGQTGLPVKVDYSPPVPPPPPFSLQSGQTFITYTSGQPVRLELTFGEGRPPYIVTINWGDGNTDSYTVKQAGSRFFEHIYDTSRPLTIVIKAADQPGTNVQIDIAAVSYARFYATAKPVYPAATIGSAQAAFNMAWWAYGTVATAVLLLWAVELFKKAFIIPPPDDRLPTAGASR